MAIAGTIDRIKPKERGVVPHHAAAPPGPRGNVGEGERVGSAVLGGTLLVLGLSRRSLGGLAVAVAGGGLLSRAITGHCRLYEKLGVDTARGGTGVVGAPDADAEAVSSITIDRPAADLDRLWRDPPTLTKILGGYAEVTPAGEGRSRWEVRTPLGGTLGWDLRIVEDQPGRGHRWESLEGAGVPNEGEIRFRPAPAGRGTEVRLRVRFDPPGGAIGGALAKLLGFAPRLMASRTLRYFKCLAETGEIPTTDRQPAARADTR